MDVHGYPGRYGVDDRASRGEMDRCNLRSISLPPLFTPPGTPTAGTDQHHDRWKSPVSRGTHETMPGNRHRLWPSDQTPGGESVGCCDPGERESSATRRSPQSQLPGWRDTTIKSDNGSVGSREKQHRFQRQSWRIPG